MKGALSQLSTSADPKKKSEKEKKKPAIAAFSSGFRERSEPREKRKKGKASGKSGKTSAVFGTKFATRSDKKRPGLFIQIFFVIENSREQFRSSLIFFFVGVAVYI